MDTIVVKPKPDGLKELVGVFMKMKVKAELDNSRQKRKPLH